MDDITKNSVNKLAMIVGCIVAIQGSSVNFIISLAITLGLAFVGSSLFGNPIRDAVQNEEVTKQDITRMLLSSPYLWAGLVCFVWLAVFL